MKQIELNNELVEIKKSQDNAYLIAVITGLFGIAFPLIWIVTIIAFFMARKYSSDAKNVESKLNKGRKKNDKK